jgi:hypothetical protein
MDWGQTKGDKTSTIIDVTCDPPVILREGAISREMIGKYINIKWQLFAYKNKLKKDLKQQTLCQLAFKG